MLKAKLAGTLSKMHVAHCCTRGVSLFFSMLFSTQKGAGFTFNSFKVRLPFVESCQSAKDTDQDAMLDVGFKVFLWFTESELITWSHGGAQEEFGPQKFRTLGSLQDVAWSIIMGSQRI